MTIARTLEPTPAELSDEFCTLLEQVMSFLEKLTLPIRELRLEEAHRDTLRRLGELSAEGDEAGPPRGKRRARRSARGGGRVQWKRIIDLKDLEAHEAQVSATVRKFGDDAERFLNARGTTHRIIPFSDERTGDAFTTRYRWTVWRVGQRQASHMYTLFGYLFWFDFVKIIHPKGTGRVGVNMERRIRSVVEDIAPIANLDPEDVARRAKAWSIRGRKLNHLCERFGDGIVLFLHSELSDDFLDNKYTASGQGHDEAFAKLDELSLQDKARESGAAALAARVREYLIRPFRKAAGDLGDRDGDGDSDGDEEEEDG